MGITIQYGPPAASVQGLAMLSGAAGQNRWLADYQQRSYEQQQRRNDIVGERAADRQMEAMKLAVGAKKAAADDAWERRKWLQDWKNRFALARYQQDSIGNRILDRQGTLPPYDSRSSGTPSNLPDYSWM